MSMKKNLILYLPYLIIGLFASKLPQAWRFCPGASSSEKLLHIADGFSMNSPRGKFEDFRHFGSKNGELSNTRLAPMP